MQSNGRKDAASASGRGMPERVALDEEEARELQSRVLELEEQVRPRPPATN